MIAEARRFERTPISQYHKEGSFHVISYNKKFHYLRANNISQGGICIEIPSALYAGESVQFRYISTTKKLELEGMVAWCKKEQASDYPKYRAGLQFKIDGQEASAKTLCQLFT
ncbi:MAG: PilZ domain-containing protein [Gammaproteobacteria bacterium]|nr:PilZ domain-containing protein [Gammaproteobacteria bacterium]